MNIKKTSSNFIEYIRTEKFDIPFSERFGVYVKNNDKEYKVKFRPVNDVWQGSYEGIIYRIFYENCRDYLKIRIALKNVKDCDYIPHSIWFDLGIDTYMAKYPDWQNQFFPTHLRCEKTHLTGYMMSPEGKVAAIACTAPVASYHLNYNIMWGMAWGHRIYSACIDFIHKGPLPERHPEAYRIRGGEEKEYNVYIIPMESIDGYEEKIHAVCGLSMISTDKYTLEKGEIPKIDILSENPHEEWTYPDGSVHMECKSFEQLGKYTLRVKDNDKISEISMFCRPDWSTYLKQARIEAYNKPQRATTHCESWYGFFSAFLAAKHYPDKAVDEKLEALYNEVMPLIYDRDCAEAKLIPWRIQNISSFISLLVCRYELDREKNLSDLKLAARFAERIMEVQNDDGAYLSRGEHYTCVIYVAKSMLELAKVELEHKEYEIRRLGKLHFKSAGKAIDNLVVCLDNIGTEGELTLEDGMISCSALQIGMYALMLPENKREKYINAAEYMINVHKCLEQTKAPDCRFNSCSLRFWEAQYDVMIMHNFVNSPHGWTAWTIYAKYYLYLLTGKVEYLKSAVNAMGACAQLMTLDGKLRWAFAVDPYIETKRFFPDERKQVKDGYKSLKLADPNYRPIFRKTVIGEEYIDMVSGWNRQAEAKPTGGFWDCIIEYPDRTEKSIVHGSTCDNDVHEIFKCMEEVFLKKTFVAEEDDGSLYVCGGVVKDNVIMLSGDTEILHINMKNERMLKFRKHSGEEFTLKVGKGFRFTEKGW